MPVDSTKPTLHVTAEDQKLINRFARLHQQSVDLSEKLLSKATELQNLADASDELLLLDDKDAARIPFRIGSAFVMYDQESMEQKLEEMQKDVKAEIESINETNDKLQSEMTQLKSNLYGKFGDSINLETSKDD